MISITEQAEESRVFYFHEFIYFTQSLKFELNEIDGVIKHLLNLLIIFDEILIPAEHLNISNNLKEAGFKSEFLKNPIIQELIYRGKIVTTIWSQCSTPQEHFEASERYLNNIGAKNHSYISMSRPYISGIQVYQRNPTHQSGKAKSYTKKSMEYDGFLLDSLSYNDGSINIGFSHEKLFLGESQKFLNNDKELLNKAQSSYIKAMPDGNGRVYRSLIPFLESNQYGTSCTFNIIGDFPGGIHPALFSFGVLNEVLVKLSFMQPCYRAYSCKKWLSKFLHFTTNNPELNKLRRNLFLALQHVSKYPMLDVSQIGHALKYIHPIRYWNIGKVLWSIPEFLSGILGLSHAVHESAIRGLPDRFYYFPACVVAEYNFELGRYQRV